MKVSFQINDIYLLAHTIEGVLRASFSSDDKKSDLQALADKSRDLSRYASLFRGSNSLVSATIDDLFIASQEIPRLLDAAVKSPEYEVVKEQTKEYMLRVQMEWEKNKDKTQEIVQELTGYDFSEKEFTVVMTHPSLRNGSYRGKGLVTWGHSPEFENYDVVYLWHEFLHEKMPNGDIPHAVQELVADNELRVRLDKTEKYPPLVGHRNLLKLKEAMLEDWREYLDSEKKDIGVFAKKMEGKYAALADSVTVR